MKRCIANFKGGYINLPADRMEREESLIFVYNGTELVAMLDIGILDSIWISEVRDERPNCL